jgi:PKD repeat protein
VVIDWGDSVTETAVYPSGSTSFTLTHLYLDDDPTATPADVYTVTLVATDSDGGSDTDTALVTVNNVAPTVAVGSDQSVGVHTAVSFSGSFTDPGLLDTFTIQWDFGDGITVTGVLSPTHSFSDISTYTVTLIITADDGGVGQDSLTVSVEPHQLFLPAVFNRSCQESSTLADVLIALDTSESMNAPTETGGLRKIEAAQAAASQFLNILPLPENQAAIVTFSDTATLLHPLSQNRASLLNALQNLPLLQQTRIDLALALARGELTGPRHISSHDTILILLTDGIPVGTAEAAVLAEATAAKAAGITIYTIGLGADVNATLLQAIATDPNLYYPAPSAVDLDEIYAQIAAVIQCQE